MARVDFYILSGQDPQARRLTACRLVEKACRQGRSVYLQTASEEDTALFDNLLWTFRQGSFVPHETAARGGQEDPVLVGHEPPPEFMADVLVNVTPDMPHEFDRFSRIAELIDQDEAVRQAGRQRYKRYQEAGHELLTHHLE